MGKYCVVANCGRMAREGLLGLHTFPADSTLRQVWTDFVRQSGRPEFTPASGNMLCSMHFPQASFSKDHMSGYGDTKKVKRMRLKTNAVPTVQSITDQEWMATWSPQEQKDIKFERRKSDRISVYGPRKNKTPTPSPVKEKEESQSASSSCSNVTNATPSAKSVKEEKRRAELEVRRLLPELMLQRATSENNTLSGPPPVNVMIKDLNSLITCEICHGYFVEATTITECLHTFCKSCLVKHVNLSLHCPTCDTLIHPSIPYCNMKLDTAKQDIVNKLLPHIEKDERERLVHFYRSRNLPLPGEEKSTASIEAIQDRLEYMMREVKWTSVIMDYVGSHKDIGKFQPLLKKYLRVPVTTTIGHLQKYVTKKLHLGVKFKPVILVHSSLVHECLSLEAIRAMFFASKPEDSNIVLRYGVISSDFILEEEEPEPIPVLDLPEAMEDNVMETA